jgi:hypothetical protein
MASIATVRADLLEACETVVRAFDYMPTDLPGTLAIVGFPTTYRPVDSTSSAIMIVPVTLYVPYTANRAAERDLEPYLATTGDDSLIAAIHAQSTAYSVDNVRDFGVLENAQGQPVKLGCVLEVTVLT